MPHVSQHNALPVSDHGMPKETSVDDPIYDRRKSHRDYRPIKQSRSGQTVTAGSRWPFPMVEYRPEVCDRRHLSVLVGGTGRRDVSSDHRSELGH